MKSYYTMRRTVFLLLLLSMVFMLSGTVYADPCSDFFGRSGVTIGIIGASNDVSQSYDAFLKQLCPETTFVNKAVGSASPQKQLAEQLPHFLTNPVDLLIINPSGNGVCDATGGYKEAVKDILFRVKDQSPDTKTVLLTVSPRAGAAGQNNDCVKKFNTEVLTTTNEYNADFIVDIYPILEDPLGSGYCGYCGADRLHWTYFGDKRVALTIFYNVFKQTSPPADEMSTPPAGGATKGTPSATTEPTAPPATTPLISQNCNNQQRCKEIDEAWLKLGFKGDQVWVPGKGWYDKSQVYGGTIIPSSSPIQDVKLGTVTINSIADEQMKIDIQKGKYDLPFLVKVENVARELGINPIHLMAVMRFESAGTFDPAKQNPTTKATGLIQFLDKSAAAVGTTKDELKQMTQVQQMDFVQKYFQQFTLRPNNLGDVAMAVIWPKAIGKSDSYVLFSEGSGAYSANKKLDRDDDGDVERSEYVEFVQKNANYNYNLQSIFK